MATAFIPPNLRSLTGGIDRCAVMGSNVRQVIAELETRFPGIAQRLQQGDSLSPGLAVVIDGVVASRGLWTAVPPTCEIHFLPAIAGG